MEMPRRDLLARGILALGASGQQVPAAGNGADANLRADLAGPDGAALAGFTAGRAGTVVRSLQDKLRDVVSAKDFGAVADGVTDNAVAFDKIIEAVESGITIHFPLGVYASSSSLRFQAAAARVTADPGTRIKMLAAVDAVMEFDYTSGGGFFDYLGGAENFILDGNGFATFGLWWKGVISAIFSNIRATNVVESGFRAGWAQLCTFADLTCSNNVESFTIVPLNGLRFDTASGSANTFINLCIEHVSGDGIVGASLTNTVFINGTSEGCGGAGVRIGVPGSGLTALGNTFVGMDLEENDGGDLIVDETGGNCTFLHLKGGGYKTPSPAIRIGKGALRNTFYGGDVGAIQIDAGAVDTVFRDVSLFGVGATIIDNGGATGRSRWSNLRNSTDNTRIPDSNDADSVETDLEAAATYQTDARLARHHFLNALGSTITIANPTSPRAGQILNFTIFCFGGSLAVAWGSAFKTTGWADPTTNNTCRSISFVYNANFLRWYPIAIGPNDVPAR